MPTSVLIIAHNEEKYIAKCIKSILSQTKSPDEIVLLAHNCNDKTLKIAKEFPIKIVTFNGPSGIINARIEGLNNVTGNIILCIDGDSFAKNNWIEVMTNMLKNNENILVGSWVKFKGTMFGNLFSTFNKYICTKRNKRAASWIWGVSFAFWAKDKNLVKEILQNSISLSKKLNLSRNTDDYWLSMFMSKHGNIETTNKTWVIQNTKEKSNKEALLRNIENNKNGRLIRYYFNQ